MGRRRGHNKGITVAECAAQKHYARRRKEEHELIANGWLKPATIVQSETKKPEITREELDAMLERIRKLLDELLPGPPANGH